MAPEPTWTGEWGDGNKPATRLLPGKKTKALQKMGFARTGFAMQNQSPGLISLINRFDGILNTLECGPINIWHVPESFIPGRIYPIPKKWIGNSR